MTSLSFLQAVTTFQKRCLSRSYTAASALHTYCTTRPLALQLYCNNESTLFQPYCDFAPGTMRPTSVPPAPQLRYKVDDDLQLLCYIAAILPHHCRPYCSSIAGMLRNVGAVMPHACRITSACVTPI